MTDYMNRFGAVTNTGSANVLDFGEIDERAAMQTHRTGESGGQTVVFRAASAITGSVTVKLQDSADNSTFADLETAQAVVNPRAGDFAFLPFPLIHKRYVRAATAASATGVTARIEAGVSKPRG
ncbi:MAG: hypothetical protein LBG27_00435 [Spirochaetaceae bacterium]|jgi:hypothetical protein|nr:hypothetical protein [Spirochaetaceae bacterium]